MMCKQIAVFNVRTKRKDLPWIIISIEVVRIRKSAGILDHCGPRGQGVNGKMRKKVGASLDRSQNDVLSRRGCNNVEKLSISENFPREYLFMFECEYSGNF